MNVVEVKQEALERNCKFLEKYSVSLADKVRYRDHIEAKAAITIQKFYRAYVARKVFSRLLAAKLNQEEEDFFRRELQRASDSTVWLKRSKLKRRLTEQQTVDTNFHRRREQSAICIQRQWRKCLAASKQQPSSVFSSADFPPDFISSLTSNFPHICEQYSISTDGGMVFPGLSTGPKIVRKIVPNNNNMSLFDETESEYTLEISSSSEDSMPSAKVEERTEFNTPIPGKRPLIHTSYVFEKELREDFANPYFLSSDEEEEEEEAESESEGPPPVKMCSSQSLESRISEASSTAHVCDSGFEDDTRGSSSSLSRPTAWAAEDQEYQIKKEIYSRPTAVQMCFVQEEDPEGEVSEEMKDLHLRGDQAPKPPVITNKRWSNISQCYSEGGITTAKDQKEVHKRHSSFTAGEARDMSELKAGWRTSAHLMTVEQLQNWLSVMQSAFAKTNMELVEHLADRDELQEQQDALLQRIFALKSINQSGQTEPDQQETKPAAPVLPFKRRISSFFTK